MDQQPKKENLFINIIFNIVIPSVILSKFSHEQALGVTGGLVIALAFPLGYGIMDFFTRNKINIFSVLGIINTLLTGTISLISDDPAYIAIKEAAIPGVIFILVLFSTWTKYPLVEKLILNDNVFDLEKLQQTIAETGVQDKVDKVMKNCSLLVASSFAFSSTLNYILATVIVVSMPGTEAYNEELGTLTWMSYPVIALPCTVIMAGALFYLMRQIHKLTGKDIEEFLNI